MSVYQKKNAPFYYFRVLIIFGTSGDLVTHEHL